MKQYVHFGDYSLGMAQGSLFLLTFIIFFIIFLLLLIIDFYELLKFKKRIDLIPLLLLIIFVISSYFGYANVEKPFFWKREFYKGQIYSMDCSDKIFLYKNGTCAFELSDIENRNIVSGKFKAVNDTLNLSEYDTTLVNYRFTSLYLFTKDSSLIPLKNRYYAIKKIK